jgi:hypothetical protein
MPGSFEPSRVRSLRSALPLLRRPPARQAVRFKPIIDAGDRCQLAAYTDVRFVIDQLNAVCGPRWSADYAELPTSHRSTVADDDERMLYVRCALTVFDVTRRDVGEGRDGTKFGAGPKAAYSDALKRAAVHFGVNQAIYAMRAPWLAVYEGPGRCPPGLVARSAKGHLYVPDATLDRLRDSYAQWLEGRGAAFGAPIDFGEQDDALGLDGEPSAATAPTRPGPPERSTTSDGAEVIAIGAARAETTKAASHPPAAPAAVTDLRGHAQKAGLDERGLGLLADLLCGEDLVDRLPDARVGELCRLLEAARASGITGADLRAAVHTAATHPDRAAARSALLSQLARSA